MTDRAQLLQIARDPKVRDAFLSSLSEREAAALLADLGDDDSRQRWRRDPVILAEEAGYTLDTWQQILIHCQSRQVLLNCSRQVGKTTSVGFKAVLQAECYPGSLVLLLAPSWRQSQELFRGVIRVRRSLNIDDPPESESTLRVELRNGSRIISLPSKEHTIRGFAKPDLIIVDEAARVPGELVMALRPMLAVSGGQLIALSTPFGTRGWFYDEWASEGGWQSEERWLDRWTDIDVDVEEVALSDFYRKGRKWDRFRVPATLCPRIKREFLQEELAQYGEDYYLQEYGTAFLDSERDAFRREDIDAAFAEEVETWCL